MTNSRLIIRAASRSISFLKPNSDGTATHHPYVAKSGMSVAANLRSAFRDAPFLDGVEGAAMLSVCTPVSLVPLDEFMDKETFNAEYLYNYAFPGHEHDEVVCSIIPGLDAVALFSINKDLKLVVTDRFRDVRVQHILQPVWEHLYRRSQLVPQRRKLYAYFHDGLLDIFSFQQRRFRYSNTFSVSNAEDATYYLLVVWKQLGLIATDDELHIVGKLRDQQQLRDSLSRFLRRVYFINPSADLNRSPLSLMDNLEYDMMLSE